ncbi:hypothetical protein Aperf_G00000054829 [Anoplocephala perfoliata]
MESPFIMRLMASSVSVATFAGSIIRKVLLSGKLEVVDKGVNDLQTQADRSVQHCIVNSLSKMFPGICIVGEEDLGDKDQPYSKIIEESDSSVLANACPENLKSTCMKDVVIWVDPLDGTNEFAAGLLERVTVLIGVAVRGRAVGGVVCQPFFMPDFRTAIETPEGQNRKPHVEETEQRLIWGLEGLGVFGLVGQPITEAPVFNAASEAGADEFANRIVCSFSRSTADSLMAIDACLPSKVYRIGGCGFKMLLLLEGVAHAYIYANTGCKRWDTCAGEALINTIGGRVTGVDGRQYSYAADVKPTNYRGVIVTPNATWHDSYLERLPPRIVETLVSKAPPNE